MKLTSWSASALRCHWHRLAPSTELAPPASAAVLPEGQYSDCTRYRRRLGDSLTPRFGPMTRCAADAWCRLSEGNLLRAGATVPSLRAAADERRSIAAAVSSVAALRDEAAGGAGSDAALQDAGDTQSVSSVSSDGS